jgi:excisionase family DNA binding protein
MTVPDVLLTISEAAKRAGVSVRTMRRWASGGQVTATGSGHDRRVLASSLPESAVTPSGRVPHRRTLADTVEDMTADMTVTSVEDVRVTVEADRLAALVRELTAENRDLAGQVGYLQARVQMHEDTIRALQAPAAPQSPPDASGTPEPPAVATESIAPWWKRLGEALGYGW